MVAARISFDEASGQWRVTINGDEKAPATDPWHAEDMGRVWHYGAMVTEAEYHFLLARAAWAVKNAPDDPAANPGAPIDLTKMKPIF